MKAKMQTYTVPQPDFELLLAAMGDRKTAENFAKIIESVAIDAIDDERARAITEKLGTYTMPREVIDSFHEAFGDRRKGEAFAKVFESAINAVAIHKKATMEKSF
ncbi:MAG: hypothetical protein ACRENG_18905 [bacterium]